MGQKTNPISNRLGIIRGWDSHWYGGKNFYVITRYNQSSYYAMSVHQLAQKIKKAYKKRYGDF